MGNAVQVGKEFLMTNPAIQKRIFIWASHTGGRKPSSWANILCLSRHVSRKLDVKQRVARTLTHRYFPMWDAQTEEDQQLMVESIANTDISIGSVQTVVAENLK